MKETICVLMFLCFFVSLANAAEQLIVNGTDSNPTGNKIGVRPQSTMHTVSCMINDDDNSVTALTVDLEASLEGLKWFTLTSHPFQDNADCTGSEAPYSCCTGAGTGTCDELTNKAASFVVINAPY